jgi:hypothetical protein
MRDRVEETVDAVIADFERQETKSYLEAGRAYAAATVEALNQKWVAALTAVAFGDDARLGEWGDLGAELRLRGLPQPDALVPAKAMAALSGRVRDATPEDIANVRKSIGRVRRRWERASG